MGQEMKRGLNVRKSKLIRMGLVWQSFLDSKTMMVHLFPDPRPPWPHIWVSLFFQHEVNLVNGPRCYGEESVIYWPYIHAIIPHGPSWGDGLLFKEWTLRPNETRWGEIFSIVATEMKLFVLFYKPGHALISHLCITTHSSIACIH